ncbi:MAG: HAMP domain-containing sensor histidine kinase [Myxococcota bacterium]
MRLATRLWLLGALLPGGVMLIALLLAGQAFRAAQESSLDRALLAQAAAESVSLFDRPDGPHLHMAESPLLESVRPFAPTGELFDDTGALVAHFPPEPHLTDRVAPSLEGPGQEFSTVEDPPSRTRQLVVRLSSGDGRRWALRLSASLAQLDAGVRTFHVVAISFALGAGAILLMMQLVLARRLSRRLGRLSQHLERVKQGRLEEPPEPDEGLDEVADLRRVLADATEQLKRARAGQDRLLADAAHELRTPLTLMLTSLDLALRRERTPQELRTALEDAREEVKRLASLSTHLLDLAAASRGWDATPGDLRQLLDEAAEAARAQAEVNGVLLNVQGPRPATARFSAVALRQAIDNLLSNALRFAPAGSTVTLEVRRLSAGWQIHVVDQGPGIPADQAEAVFSPFHRLDRRGGSGLGLAIVSEVLRQHGGTARVQPEQKGAHLVLEIPDVTP